MAVLKVFVSSTCHDLAGIRDQLRGYLDTLGHEPIMSEYNDVLFDYRSHTHENCIRELSNADVVIFIIGSRFGGEAIPEAISTVKTDHLEALSKGAGIFEKLKISITQLEILRAIELDRPIFTFVESGVLNDHRFYEKNKAKDFLEDLEFPSIEKKENAVYIFEFINFIMSRRKNNGIAKFENFFDIQDHLRIQLSALLQRFLSEDRLLKSMPRGSKSLSQNRESITELEHRMSSANEMNREISNAEFIRRNLIVRSGPSFDLPKINRNGDYEPETGQEEMSDKIKKELKLKINDECGAIPVLPKWENYPMCINYVQLKYSEIKALRKYCKKQIYILSGNAILFSEERKIVLVHRRAPKCADFAEKLHSFGGGFIPPDNEKLSDLNGITETVRREIFEETGICVNIPSKTPIIVIDEFDLQFLQISFLGINLTYPQLTYLRPNWEGGIEKVEFDELKEKMKDYDDWTPSGWLHVLNWLYMDCPNSINELKFNGKTGRQLAIDLIADMKKYKPKY